VERAREQVVVLKTGPTRTVELREVDGKCVIVKRFHHPGLLQRLRDRGRAHSEFEALGRLHRAGLRVPRPLAVVHRRGSQEVHMEAVPGAVSLEDLLNGTADPPDDWSLLCARLGRLLASLIRAPFEHTDLHPGNVLVDGAGEPWCVDFHASRAGRDGAERLRTELVRAAAFGRERVPVRARLRFLAALRRSVPELALAGADLPALEQAARIERRTAVEQGAGRWLRDSSRCRTQDVEHGRVYQARAFQVDGAPELLREGPAPEARARWLAAARLVEHGIPVVIPRRLVLLRGNAREAYARALAPTARSDALPTRPDLALGRARALLTDRGLAIDGLGEDGLVRTNEGTLVLAPPVVLRALEPLAEA